MRAALITPEYPPECGGIGHYVSYLAQALARRGVEPTVMVRSRSDGERTDGNGVRVLHLRTPGMPPFNNFLFRRRVEREVRRGGYDLAHIHSASMPLPGAGVPEIVTSHSCIKEITGLFYRPVRDFESLYRNIMLKPYCLVEGALARRCSIFTVVSRSMADDYMKHYGVAARVVYNGVDSEAFRPLKGKRSANRVVYIGSFKRGKGLLDLLAAVAMLNRTNPGTGYYLYGSGPLKKRMEDYISAHRLGNVHLSGPVGHRELAGILARAAVFVLPSYYEGMPNSILEAMACETPVAVSNVKGNPELVEHNVTGLLFEERNPADMASKLDRLLSSPLLRAVIGRNGRELVAKKYTWEMMAERFVRLYKEL